MRYNPALDGLRAVAILLVLAYHYDYWGFPGGWLGVDIFFVLSGYLITSILLNEYRNTAGIDFGRFFMRRVLRLTPALAIVAAFLLVRSLFVSNGAEIREATLISAAYLENWNMVFHFGPLDVLGHTWSLATEEQFYLVWPFAFLVLVRRRPLVWLAAALAAMMAARVIWSADHDGMTFGFGLRPVGLLVGCALAFMPIKEWRLPAIAGPVLLAALLAAIPLGEAAHVITPLMIALVTAGMIICLQGPGLIASILAAGPIRYVGKISYGLYLYHWPILVLSERWRHMPLHLYAGGVIAVVFAAATLSYELIEKPFLRFKDRARVKAPIVPDFLASEAITTSRSAR
jgi:peptidoglycan/LPS O-acetylase OafA/YrhL